ncbi:DNA-binding protein [Anaerotignum sp.]|uniref:DNA-binding protein n=1 Tax=Anaerotignum sp. TaxID=2039241 RepID=UPI0028B0070A|nr:DNA-binding protein [Anaerotignum sp.]
MNNKAKMLTIKQAANVVEGITEYRIRQMCISGELPCFKAGKKYLINENTLRKVVMGEDVTEVNEHE